MPHICPVLADVGFHGCPPVTLHWQPILMLGHLHPVHSGAELCGIPHLPKPGRYGAPGIRYGTGREKCGLTLFAVQFKSSRGDPRKPCSTAEHESSVMGPHSRRAFLKTDYGAARADPSVGVPFFSGARWSVIVHFSKISSPAHLHNLEAVQLADGIFREQADGQCALPRFAFRGSTSPLDSALHPQGFLRARCLMQGGRPRIASYEAIFRRRTLPFCRRTGCGLRRERAQEPWP